MPPATLRSRGSLPAASRAPALARATQARGPPRGPYREGRAAAPPELSPGLCVCSWRTPILRNAQWSAVQLATPRSGLSTPNGAATASRLLKKAHIARRCRQAAAVERWRARALAAAYPEYASDPPSVGAPPSRAALHLGLFEQPAQNGFGRGHTRCPLRRGRPNCKEFLPRVYRSPNPFTVSYPPSPSKGEGTGEGVKSLAPSVS